MSAVFFHNEFRVICRKLICLYNISIFVTLRSEELAFCFPLNTTHLLPQVYKTKKWTCFLSSPLILNWHHSYWHKDALHVVECDSLASISSCINASSLTLKIKPIFLFSSALLSLALYSWSALFLLLRPVLSLPSHMLSLFLTVTWHSFCLPVFLLFSSWCLAFSLSRARSQILIINFACESAIKITNVPALSIRVFFFIHIYVKIWGPKYLFWWFLTAFGNVWEQKNDYDVDLRSGTENQLAKVNRTRKRLFN